MYPTEFQSIKQKRQLLEYYNAANFDLISNHQYGNSELGLAKCSII